MIAEHQTDRVYISDLLATKHPQIKHDLCAELGNRVRTIPGTKDIWCRDYMPIQLDADRFVQFRYDPDYLKDDPQLRTKDGASLLDLPNCTCSNLVIDGGNIVRWHDAAILTDKIYRENPRVERSRLRDRLRALLEVNHLIEIPKEPCDKIGHADGMVRFVNDKTVLVNDYRKQKLHRSFRERLAKALHDFEIVPFPYSPTGEVIDGIDSAEGVYINFLQINDTIFVPVYGWRQDDEAVKILGQVFPRYRIIAVPSKALAREGGVLNCVTWDVKFMGSGK